MKPFHTEPLHAVAILAQGIFSGVGSSRVSNIPAASGLRMIGPFGPSAADGTGGRPSPHGGWTGARGKRARPSPGRGWCLAAPGVAARWPAQPDAPVTTVRCRDGVALYPSAPMINSREPFILGHEANGKSCSMGARPIQRTAVRNRSRLLARTPVRIQTIPWRSWVFTHWAALW